MRDILIGGSVLSLAVGCIGAWCYVWALERRTVEEFNKLHVKLNRLRARYADEERVIEERTNNVANTIR